MAQQLVKKDSNGRYSNVMPNSWIEAIKDKSTGQTLVEILQGFNMYFLPYNGNTSATRCSVPMVLRKKGLWITYVKYDGNVYTEWYAASDIDDKSWGDSSNWRIGNNTLVGDITISADGNWVINGAETEFKAVGEKGNTPLLRVANNRLQVSYDLGDTYIDVTNNPVYTKFRWHSTTGDTQANNIGRIQASTDEGKTWTNMSNDFTNNLHISRYIGVNESLPTSGIAEGTIYAKGPTYAVEDTSNSNPIYRLWVYAWKDNTLAWQDNGEFTSIAAGIVQETGSNENAVMSQKATTEKLTEFKKNVEGEVTPSIDIDITSYAEGSNFIDNTLYFVSPYYKGRFIPCEAGKTYTFKANANNTSILAYLANTDNITTGETPHFADGWTKTRNVLAGQSVSLKAPIDANYIWVSSQNGTGRPNDFQSIVREPFTKKGLKDYAMIASVAEQGFPQNDLPVISFVFDDLDINDDDIVNLFNEYGIKCGFAFIASDAKMQENKERYLEYQRQGFSILNHSIDGKIFNTTNYPTMASAYTAIMTAKQKLESNGFIVNGFVAPSSEFENSYIDTLRNTHQYAYTTADLANTRSSNPCNISRESLQRTSLADILGGVNIQTSIAFHIAVNRQLTFYGHTADFGTSYDGEVFNLEKIRSVVERCISLRNEGKCIILSPNEMANYFFRGQINTNSNVSINRPISPQKGMMFFDLTLNKPIWYSGTSWVDANGTNV